MLDFFVSHQFFTIQSKQTFQHKRKLTASIFRLELRENHDFFWIKSRFQQIITEKDHYMQFFE